MPINDLTFRIGGEAGQGIESSGAGFIQALSRAGLHALAIPSYYSRIRGGHNYFTVRVSEKPVLAVRNQIHILSALTGETVERHIDELAPGGALLIDEETDFPAQVLDNKDVHLVRLPLLQIAKDHGNPVMVNTAALAVVAGITGLDLRYILEVIQHNFGKKGSDVVQANEQVAQEAYLLAKESLGAEFAWKLEARESPPRMSIDGNTAFAMGALMGGCKFVAGYPMTPATSVLQYMAKHAHDWGLVVKHAESEIAAVNMLVGAANAGVRSMAPTSGGGFDLMTEGLSLAGMIEAPIVIYLAQRPGPATGLATRTGQGDLLLSLFSSHGEFPRVVMAPHTPEEAFHCGYRALNIAEKYQCLVIVVSDQYNATAVYTVDPEPFRFEQVQIDRGKLLSAHQIAEMDSYERYAITPDGISPRAIPGTAPQAAYLATGNEHRPDGHITEDPVITTQMADKRLHKLEEARAEMRGPLCVGPAQADVTFVSWGSSYGPVRETIDILNARGQSANMVQFIDLWPFPAQQAQDALSDAKRIIDVEGNATAQLALLLRAFAGIQVDAKILKYDGRGFTPDYILEHLEG